MTDVSITAANVIRGANSKMEHGQAGASITAGQVVYRDAADGEYKLADSDSGTAAVRSPRGIALNNGADGQPLTIHRSGLITIGGTLTPGVAYYLSDTPGGIAPYADLATGDYPTFIGMAVSTTVLNVSFNESGVALS